VGAGGEFSVVTPKRTNFAPFIGGGILILVIVVVVLLLMGGPTTTTTAKVVGPPAACMMWGDPHVETFDHGFPNLYDEGEFWVVLSGDVKIQARYLATPFTNGLSATHQIAVSGAFIGDHKIVVGPMENGQITMDGQPILQAFPSTVQNSFFQLSYNSQGQLVDNAQGHLEKHIVHMDLGSGADRVHLQVMRWANHLNVRITMSAREGQDGACGNFNGNAVDDSTAAIKARIGQRVAPSELIFNVPAQVGPAGRHVTIADCPQTKRQHGMELCKGSQPGVQSQSLLESCVFDVCFGGDQYAGEDGLAESQA
jgi:hypothetical protein